MVGLLKFATKIEFKRGRPPKAKRLALRNTTSSKKRGSKLINGCATPPKKQRRVQKTNSAERNNSALLARDPARLPYAL